MHFYIAEPFISLLNLGSPVGCITGETCMSFCTSGVYAGSRELIFLSFFCLISAAQQDPCSPTAALHLLKSDVGGKRTLWHCATSVRSACAAGRAGTIPLAELGLDALPLPHAFVTFLSLNAAFFSVKCSKGLLSPILLIMGLNLDPSWKDFSPSLSWTKTGLKMCWFSPYLQLLQFLKYLSHYTCSNLQRLESSSQCWMGQSYSTKAVPTWRALVSAGALLCRWMFYGLSSLATAMGAGELEIVSLQRIPVSFWENGSVLRCQVYLGTRSSQEPLADVFFSLFLICPLQFPHVLHLG